MDGSGTPLNSEATKSRQGPKRQARINPDGPGHDGYSNKAEITAAQYTMAPQPGMVPGNRWNVSSYDAQDTVNYQSPYGDYSTMGQGLRPTVVPPTPTIAQQMHPDVDFTLQDKAPHAGYGSGPAPGDAESLQVPQQATFGMKGGNGKMKGQSLASSGKAKGTKFGLGPAGSGPQRNVSV